MSDYSIDRELRCPFREAVEKVKEALKEKGFGTLSEIDVQAALREKIGASIGGYTILGVCNPRLAADAIAAEENIGVFLPCTVLLREDGNVIRIAAQDPALMQSMIANPALETLSKEARTKIVAALDSLD